MKKIFLILTAAISVASCSDFLEFDETANNYTREDMYEYYYKAQQMLVTVYGYMPYDFGTVGGAMRDCASDDAEYANTQGSVQSFNNGNWSATTNSYLDGSWSLYNGIRAANEFIESIATADFSRFENDTSYDNWMKKLAYHTYEARVLRAHYLFELARRYGDIAMPLKMLTVEEANSIGKTPFAEVVEFIADECDECAANLPIDYLDMPDAEFGRVTKGFAMAVKSKALLYAASELHNTTDDTDKWKASALAAHDIIKLDDDGAPAYSLDPVGVLTNLSSTKLEGGNLSSTELVQARMFGSYSSYVELANFPIRFTEKQRSTADGNFPTQNLVDAFQTKNGYSVTLSASGWESDDPDFDPLKPYSNRDPRFQRTILANGNSFKGSTIEVYSGGADYALIENGGSTTGYFLKKYVQEDVNFVQNEEISTRRFWVIYRYAETLLTYAESMIEAFGSPSYKDDTYTLSALEALNMVRVNAGMPELNSTANAGYDTAEGFIEAVRNEWRVEFAFEDHRFWDIRRWNIGDTTQREIYGVNIQKLDDGTLSFRRVLCESRYWNTKMNLYPIPQAELFNNPNLAPQNAGW